MRRREIPRCANQEVKSQRNGGRFCISGTEKRFVNEFFWLECIGCYLVSAGKK